MKNYSASQRLIDLILKECSATGINHDDFVYALMLLLFSDMRAFGDSEHTLCDKETGEIIMYIRKVDNE